MFIHKKLTITLEQEVYEGLHRVIGRGKISGFIERLVRPQVTRSGLDESDRQLAQDDAGELRAVEWVEELQARDPESADQLVRPDPADVKLQLFATCVESDKSVVGAPLTSEARRALHHGLFYPSLNL